MAEATQKHQPVKGPRIKKGLVVVNTGNGKGKTTAALGVLFRAWGRDMNVQMFQFLFDHHVDLVTALGRDHPHASLASDGL